MCRWLNIPRSSYYYQAVEPVSEDELEEKIKRFFLKVRLYGARKIKKGLEVERIRLSRRRIMKKLNLISLYQEVSFKSHSKGKSDAAMSNI